MSKEIEDLLNWLDSKKVVDIATIRDDLILKYEHDDEVMYLIDICEQIAYQNGLNDGLNRESLK